MVGSITHKKTDAITDFTQADLDAQIALGNYPSGTVLADIVLPSDWNDTHNFTLTTADVTASANKNYVTDAQQTVITNTSGTNTGDQFIFKTISVSGQSDVVADTTADTLTLVAGTNITITTNASTDTVTITASGGNVTKVGTPVDNQIGVWTGDGTIEGTSGLTYDGTNLLVTGSLGSTGSRLTKGWFTDLQVTNAIAADITGNAATVSSANEATDTTCFITFITASGTQTLPLKNNTGLTYNSNTNNVGATTFTGALSGNATTATALATGRTISVSGDLTYTSPSFDGSGNVTAAGTLATVNSNVGTFGSVTKSAIPTVNAKGLITAISESTITPAVGSITGLGAGVGTFLATPSSANLISAVTDETGSGALVFGTSPTITTPVLNGTPTGTGVATAATVSTLALRDSNGNITAVNLLEGYSTTTTAAGTTTLTVSSNYQQYFTGSTTQTITLPVASTLVLGQSFFVINSSSGAVTINSSGNNAVVVLAGGTAAIVTCILTSGTSAASWSAWYMGDVVASGKKLTVSNTLTFTGTDSSSVAFGAGGTVLYNGGALGTPSSATLTNATGTATGLTSGITNALKSATTTVDVSAATAPSTGQVLTATSSTAATWQAAASGSAATLSIAQSSHGFAVQDVLYLVSTTYTKAQADTAVKAEVVGMVSAVADANNFTLTLSGKVSGLSGLTAGTVYYLSPSSAGAITATEPSTTGQISKPVLVADTTTSGYLIPFRGQVVNTGTLSTLTLADNQFTLQDDGDTTKQMQFQLSGITTGTTRTLTVPNASTTIVGTDATQTLTNKTIGVTQLNGTANTIAVNNTSGTANYTATTYNANASQTYSSTIAWTGTTAPSGSTNHSYSWTQIGNLVFFRINLSYSVAGSALTVVGMDKPSDMPNPNEPPGFGAASNLMYICSGGVAVSLTSGVANQGKGYVAVNSGDTGYQFVVQSASNNSTIAYIEGHYFTN